MDYFLYLFVISQNYCIFATCFVRDTTFECSLLQRITTSKRDNLSKQIRVKYALIAWTSYSEFGACGEPVGDIVTVCAISLFAKRVSADIKERIVLT